MLDTTALEKAKKYQESTNNNQSSWQSERHQDILYV